MKHFYPFLLLLLIPFYNSAFSQCNSLTPWRAEYGVWSGGGGGGGTLTPAQTVSNGVIKVPENLLITNDPNHFLFATSFQFRDTVCITDNFTFETRIRNAQASGGVSAFDTRIEILGSGMNAGASLIDISEISWAQQYTSAWVGGTSISNQLGLMVDLQNWSIIKMEFNNGILHYSRDGVEFFQLPYTGNICNIYGFNYGFKGSGEIDWIRLTDSYNNVVYFEDFNDCNNFASFPACNTPQLTTSFTPPSCTNSSLTLQTNPNSSQPLQYNWVGPNGFSSSVQNPVNSSPTLADEGTYIVTATSNYCNPPVRDTIVVTYPISYQSSNVSLSSCYGGTVTLPGGQTTTNSGTFVDTIINDANIKCYDIFTTTVTIDNTMIDAGNNQNICLGNSAQLAATGTNILSYNWQANPTLSATNIANPVATPSQTTTYHLTSQIRIGTNLVVNGDFEQGNTGFSSAYNYFASGGLAQGGYAVTNNLPPFNSNFSNCPDHTSGSGNLMLLDGSCGSNGVPPNVQFWCQTIPVTPNTDYAFSAWMTNVANNFASSTLQFTINGNIIGTPAATNTTACLWSEFYVIWNSGAATSANICIAEGTGICGGNDFAVDDISFYQICQVADSVTVQVSNPSVTVTDSTLVNCFGGNDGRIVTAVTNGITPYSYSWTNTSQTTSTIQQLTANTYVVTITDSIGCTATRSVTISQPADIVLTNEDIAVAGCYGAADGSATFSAVGGVHPYTWLWSNGENDSIANLLNPGTHTVTITDDHNCSKTASVTIQGEASPVAQFAGQNTCLNTLSQFMNQSSIAAPNTIAASNWTVFNNGSSTPSTNTNFQETLADSGSYTVQLIVTGSNGCADTVTQTHVVYPNPEADFTYQSICYQVNQFSDSSINYTSQNLSYFWDIDGNGQMDYYTKAFTHTYPTASPQMVTLRVEDANGCYDTITKQVYVTQNSDTLQVPNILVLSSMQNNDKLDFEAFAPDFNQCISYSLFIYNRWGNLVFETKNDKNNPDTSCNHCFTGKTQGGTTLSAGTYFYVIQGEKEIIRKGSITIFD